MPTVFFEQQRLCEDLGFAKTEAISMGTYKELYHQGAQSIRRMREGIEQIQRRLEELQRQHLMDQQQLTEARMRALLTSPYRNLYGEVWIYTRSKL